ncbi:Eye-specific diacylglycerol kinase [Gryllus bimaculatus]|nr:Eye-specific diacylglycerol kinase [Gryllus bimaculatus]
MESLSWWKRIVSWVAPRAPVALTKETLLEAAQNGDAVLVKTLLALGIEPDEVRTRHGESALWLAAQRGRVDVALVLLEAGADPCMQDVTGDTPLIRAAVDEEGRTALHYAAIANKPECVTLLLVSGADRFAKDNAGQTPIDLAVTDKVRHLLLTAPYHVIAHSADSSNSGEMIPLQLLRFDFIPPQRNGMIES